MRYGICTELDNLEVVEQLGYDYIELSVTSVMKMTEEEVLIWKEKLNNSSIRCEVFNVLFPKTFQLLSEKTDWNEIQTYLENAFSRVKQLGGKIVVFGSGKSRNCEDDQSFIKAYQKLVSVLEKTGEIADKYGITLVVEPLNRNETNMICSMKEGAMLCADVNRSNVKLLADYYHVATDNDHLDDMKSIREFAHLHIASEHGRRYPLSEQNENYRRFFENLAYIRYQGRMSIEGKTDSIKEDGLTALQLMKSLEAKTYEQG